MTGSHDCGQRWPDLSPACGLSLAARHRPGRVLPYPEYASSWSLLVLWGWGTVHPKHSFDEWLSGPAGQLESPGDPWSITVL